MGNMLIGRLLRLVGAKMDGYKTAAGGIGMILLGIAGLLGQAFPDQQGLPKMEIDDSLTLIAGGLGVLGIGGKLEKTKAAVSGNKPGGGDH